jgi:NAD(P)-dependent dehydrogenase (short-subunit alcohol dehydrogenase family)
MMDFAGKTAVVTGAASGIGLALARRFAQEGMNVVLADVEESRLGSALAEVKPVGSARAIAVGCDVSVRDQVFALADRARDEFGTVNIICNNAGVESGALFTNIPQSVWDWVMAVNFSGVLYGCQAFLPLLRAAGEGHIVNTGSMASIQGTQLTAAPYVAAKFAVLGLSENLYVELADAAEDIGISVLLPGMVKTNMGDSERNRPGWVAEGAADEARERQRAWVREGLANGRDPDWVAGLVLDGIRNRRFHIPTHPEFALRAVERRVDWLRADLGLLDGDHGPTVLAAAR